MKCLVKACPNDSSEGVFIGELCGPCHDALANGCRHDFMRERFVPEFKLIKELENKRIKELEEDVSQARQSLYKVVDQRNKAYKIIKELNPKD